MRTLLFPRDGRGSRPTLLAVGKVLITLHYVTNVVVGFGNSRHVCFINDYDVVQGPHFAALFDELVTQTGAETKRVALFTATSTGSDCITSPVGQSKSKSTAKGKRLSTSPVSSILKGKLEQDLELDICSVIPLEQFNPVTLAKHLQALDPTVYWVADGNAFALRYLMRTSGLDGIIQEKCGSMESNILFVGQGAGSVCGGHSMKLAYVRGDDPKFAPEPQFVGLNLVGPERSVYFGDKSSEELENHPKLCKGDISDDLETEKILTLSESAVYVWSQERQEGSGSESNAMSFVMNPKRKGMIELMKYPDPVPPLVSEDGNKSGGRHCVGEPAVDPSRTMQMIGDSEWFEEGNMDI